jgi:hypothetical protein
MSKVATTFALWSKRPLLEARLAEESTYERYTGYTSPFLFAHKQTKKAVEAFRRAWTDSK